MERQSFEVARAVSNGLAEIGILSDAVDTTNLKLSPFAIDRLVVVMPRPSACRSGGRRLCGHRASALCRAVRRRIAGSHRGSGREDRRQVEDARAGTHLRGHLPYGGWRRRARHSARIGSAALPQVCKDRLHPLCRCVGCTPASNLRGLRGGIDAARAGPFRTSGIGAAEHTGRFVSELLRRDITPIIKRRRRT